MLKISKLADYSISIVHVLMEKGACVSVATVSKRTLIPEPTVSKILKKLSETGIVSSSKGSQGGYQLAKDPTTISLAAVITAIDGKPAMTHCCKQDYLCAQEPACGLKNNWQWINHKIFSMLDEISVQTMRGRLKDE